jgi:hypothetical protein
MGAIKRGLPFAVALAALVVAGAGKKSRASDHIDGIKTALDNAADITDVFTFKSPTNPNKLVLIMNSHGIAFSTSRFSNAVDYKFRLRPISDSATLAASNDARSERSIVCNFSGGTFLVNANQRAKCTLNLEGGQEVIEFDTRGSNEVRAGGMGEKNGTRIFAGVRSDPWFLDLAKTLKYNAGLPVLDVPGANGLHGQNVLSIVVEIDINKVPGPLLAVTGQTVRK